MQEKGSVFKVTRPRKCSPSSSIFGLGNHFTTKLQSPELMFVFSIEAEGSSPILGHGTSAGHQIINITAAGRPPLRPVTEHSSGRATRSLKDLFLHILIASSARHELRSLTLLHSGLPAADCWFELISLILFTPARNRNFEPPPSTARGEQEISKSNPALDSSR